MNWIHQRHPPGFILAEALVALLILGVVFLALEGSLSTVIRTIADSEHEAIAARLAETQRERAFAAACASSSGADSANTVVVTWSASATGSFVHLIQTSRYPRRVGDRIETYDATGACR
jgi:Tfp pilus assembly protein PilV